MGKKRITKILSLLLVMFTAMNITAFAGNTYYAKAIATAVGNGKVYVGVLNTTPSEDLYQTTSENTGPGTGTGGSGNANVSFYLFAQPGASNIKFEGWYDNAECTGDALSTDNPYNATINSNEPISAKAVTKNYYAKFVEDNNGPLELEVSLVAFDETKYALIPERIVTIDVPIKGIKVDGLEQGSSVSYTLEENGNILAEGEISDNSIACPEFGPFYFYETHSYTLTLTSGSKTVYTANVIGAMEVYDALKDLLRVTRTWYDNNSQYLYDELFMELDDAIDAGQAATDRTPNDELLTLIGNLQTAFVNAKAGLALVEELKATSAELANAYTLYAESASSEVLGKAESLITMVDLYFFLTGDDIQQLLDDMKECLKDLRLVNVTLNAAGYATYSCNMATTIETAGVKAYKAAVDGETITLTELTGNIPAGTGVILYGESAGTQVVFAVATSGEDADVTGNDLKATMKADDTLVTLEENTWALGDGNEFLLYTGTTYIPNRAYLVHEAANANMRIVFADSETTSISNAVSNGASVEGKFLVNGNIVIIKNGTKHNVAGQVVK